MFVFFTQQPSEDEQLLLITDGETGTERLTNMPKITKLASGFKPRKTGAVRKVCVTTANTEMQMWVHLTPIACLSVCFLYLELPKVKDTA